MLAIPHRYASKQEYLQSRSLEPLLLRSPKKDDPTSRKERVNMNQLRTAGCRQLRSDHAQGAPRSPNWSMAPQLQAWTATSGHLETLLEIIIFGGQLKHNLTTNSTSFLAWILKLCYVPEDESVITTDQKNHTWIINPDPYLPNYWKANFCKHFFSLNSACCLLLTAVAWCPHIFWSQY